MELANLKGWNYFLDIKKINPVLANLHFKRKKESSAPLYNKSLNPHFIDRNSFPPLSYARKKNEGRSAAGE